MAFASGLLTEEQRAKIAENRKRALNRLQQRPAPPRNAPLSATTTLSDAASAVRDNTAASKRARIDLTPEQTKLIEQNRARALQIRQQRQLHNRDAGTPSAVPIASYNNVRLQKDKPLETAAIRPSVKKKDYIEYDFSTMKDSYGGFIGTDDTLVGSGSSDATSKTLEEWKERQRQQQVVRDAPPPLDPASAPKCYECNSIEIDKTIYDNFRGIRVCRPCAKLKPEKYSLLTKTECKEDYLLTDPELKDTELLPRLEKPNPHGFSRMQLFLRYQVEQYAWKKWGLAEKLDEEWEKRETMRLHRKEKKYEEKLKEMRKRTRAEQYTRKLRNGEALGHRHVHDWSEPVVLGDHMKRRCIDCGLETEEVMM